MSRVKRLQPGKFFCDWKHSPLSAGGNVVKGNVLATARVAIYTFGEEYTGLIPMCHSIPINGAVIDFEEGDGFIESNRPVKTTGKTGVEMEALVGVSIALLTVWDMVKSAEKDAQGQYPVNRSQDIRAIEKKKGTQCHNASRLRARRTLIALRIKYVGIRDPSRSRE